MENTNSSLRRQQGFSLVEVLVTMIIVAIGLLGYAGLQVNSMKSNHTALMRSQATLLADDILESMRANRSAAVAGEYNVSSPTTGTVAGNDLVDWKDRLETALPSGTWSITVTAGAIGSDPATVLITIGWSSNIGGAGSSFSSRTTI